MNKEELRQILHQIADTFHIGNLARDRSTIIANVTNSAFHNFCIKRPSDAIIKRASLLGLGDLVREYIMDAAGIVGEDEE